MVEIARKQYQLPNLSFRMDDGEALDSLQKDSVDGFLIVLQSSYNVL